MQALHDPIHAPATPVLPATPLTAAAFAPFGAVLEAPAEAGRRLGNAALQNRRAANPFDLSLVLKAPDPLPHRATLMERHPFTSQTFLPLATGRWLVLVAPDDPDGGPDMARAQAFLAAPDQGVTYAAGIWHHPLTVLDQPGRLAILMWRDGSPADDELHPIPPILVTG